VSCDARVELHVQDSQRLSPDLKLTTGHLKSDDSDSFSSDEDSYVSVEKETTIKVQPIEQIEEMTSLSIGIDAQAEPISDLPERLYKAEAPNLMP